MEWLTSIRTAIDYMEEHLTDNISAQDVADRVYLSPFFLQRGFSLMTGCGIGEYIRNRRLYQAARDLKET
ncbi:MAG: helix-turn-helix transcriptional regulator, partial [Oscillospiraceae bacterium]|nr:helix-turn-helix transcriptional regulator [Oscillospiraceae bacterium]